METRVLGRTGRNVGVVGFGAWQIGDAWGEVSETDALDALHAAVDSGVTFFDTADVYGDGRSERLVGRLLKEYDGLTVATKMGRRLPQSPEIYNPDNFRAWNDRSRANLGVDTIDLVQLHCPPSAVYADDAVFDALDDLVEQQRIAAYGVSVETCEQALAAISRPNVATVQIILNAFRLKPLEQVLPAAREAGVGIVARVPLASGLLSGRYTPETTFAENDHRSFNRDGAAFDVGETFSGVDFEAGIRAAAEFASVARRLVPTATTAQVALAWVAAQDGVSTVIPGARSPEQARSNAAAGALELPAELDDAVRALYDRELREAVHPRW